MKDPLTRTQLPTCSHLYLWHFGDTGRLQHPRLESPSKPQGPDSPRHRFRGALQGEKSSLGKASSSARTWEREWREGGWERGL